MKSDSKEAVLYEMIRDYLLRGQPALQQQLDNDLELAEALLQAKLQRARHGMMLLSVVAGVAISVVSGAAVWRDASTGTACMPSTVLQDGACISVLWGVSCVGAISCMLFSVAKSSAALLVQSEKPECQAIRAGVLGEWAVSDALRGRCMSLAPIIRQQVSRAYFQGDGDILDAFQNMRVCMADLQRKGLGSGCRGVVVHRCLLPLAEALDQVKLFPELVGRRLSQYRQGRAVNLFLQPVKLPALPQVGHFPAGY